MHGGWSKRFGSTDVGDKVGHNDYLNGSSDTLNQTIFRAEEQYKRMASFSRLQCILGHKTRRREEHKEDKILNVNCSSLPVFHSEFTIKARAGVRLENQSARSTQFLFQLIISEPDSLLLDIFLFTAKIIPFTLTTFIT